MGIPVIIQFWAWLHLSIIHSDSTYIVWVKRGAVSICANRSVFEITMYP